MIRNCDSCDHTGKGKWDEPCKDCCGFAHWTNATQPMPDPAPKPFKAGIDRIRRTFLHAHAARLECNVCDSIETVLDAAILGKAAEIFVRWNQNLTCRDCPVGCGSVFGDSPCNDFTKHQAEWIAAAKKQEGIT